MSASTEKNAERTVFALLEFAQTQCATGTDRLAQRPYIHIFELSKFKKRIDTRMLAQPSSESYAGGQLSVLEKRIDTAALQHLASRRCALQVIESDPGLRASGFALFRFCAFALRAQPVLRRSQ